MTKPKNETTEETPDEPTPEETEEETEEEQDAEDQQQTPEEAANRDGSADFQAQIEEAANAHGSKLRRIFGDRLHDVLCPLCEGYGIVDPGTEPLDLLQWDETSQECPTCNGYARVRKHTKDHDHMVAPCLSCGATGWITKALPAPTPLPVAYSAPTTAAPVAQPQYGYMGSDGNFVPFVNTNQG